MTSPCVITEGVRLVDQANDSFLFKPKGNYCKHHIRAAFLIHHQNMALITHGYYSMRLIFSVCLDEQDHEQAEVPG